MHTASNGGAPTSSSDALDADVGVPLVDSEDQPAADEGIVFKIIYCLTNYKFKYFSIQQKQKAVVSITNDFQFTLL